jgi:extracellular elastinolytic metalloproteinase
MRVKSPVARRGSALAASVAVTFAVGLGGTAIPVADAAPHASKTTSGAGDATSAGASDKGYYDARDGATSAQKAGLARSAALATSRRATEGLRTSLGLQAVVEMDGLTGTPRQVARLDGFLTGKSSQPASKVAMGFVRANLAALGLKRSDLRTMTLRRDYVDIAGIHHLSWTQSAGGVEVFGNGLQANVTRDGRLLSLGGSPISGLRAPTATSTRISSGSAAIAAARADVGESSLAAGGDDTAQRVLFPTSDGVRSAWQTITMSAARPMLTVVDAADGRVLYRSDLSSDASGAAPVHQRINWGPSRASTPEGLAGTRAVGKAADGDATGLAFRYFPRHKPGGKAHPVNFTKKGWLLDRAKTLDGNNSHAYSDVNADNKASKREEVRGKTPRTWNYRLKPFHLKNISFCDNPYPCSWNPNKPFSWKVNRAQNATQVFYFVNNWHDHLMAKPIGFNEAAGNFQKVNKSGKGEGHDAVRTETIDGANTDHGLPDASHIDNANMATPPDGHAPRMQMYLQHAPGTSYPDGDPFSPTNVGDEADTVYHEYTHGLSNRLVVDAAGRSTLGAVQAGSMGEAWSDWYAMDYLVGQKLQKDRKGIVDVVLFQYDGAGVFLDRTEPLDCKVGVEVPRCPGGATGHGGGYTYADYAKVIGGPEVHSDGEIWAQTLWDLRSRIGSKNSEAIVTRAMELAPSNPSFLDMRNAILLADRAINKGKLKDKIWAVFAHRGMGYFAGSLGGNDTAPGASFETPPAGHAKGTIEGTVTDSVSGDPIEGAVVTIAFQGTPAIFNPTTTTDADGNYSVGPVPRGTYPKVVISTPGYDEVIDEVTVNAATVTNDAELDRDWASFAGGGRISDFNGPNFGNPCGPRNAIDLKAAFGWSTTADLVDGQVGPDTTKFITIKLPTVVDVTTIAINPTAICGDGLSASSGSYTVEVSSNGTDFTEVADAEFVAADRGHNNVITLTGSTDAIQYVRYSITAPMVLTDEATYGADACNSGGAFSGCTYQDVTEVEVYGGVAVP